MWQKIIEVILNILKYLFLKQTTPDVPDTNVGDTQQEAETKQESQEPVIIEPPIVEPEKPVEPPVVTYPNIVDVAKKEIGYKEAADGTTKYGKWYATANAKSEWCAAFVCWCANQAGLLNKTIPKYIYVPYMLKWYKDKGKYKARGYIPKAGDLIFFDWDKNGVPNHVGLVERVTTNYIYTIEGNTGTPRQVKEKYYSKTNAYILGYGII